MTTTSERTRNPMLWSTTASAMLVAVMSVAGLFWPATYARETAYSRTGGYASDIVDLVLVVPILLISAVILGFMLYTVWTAYGEADLNVEIEANALANLYRLAEEFPESQQSQPMQQAQSYAETVINREWPEMANNQEPTESVAVSSEMWQRVKSVRTSSPTEQAQDHAISELSLLSRHRLTRRLQSTTRLPKVLWCVLLVGGA